MSRSLSAPGGTVAANDYQCDTCHIGTLNTRRTTVTYWVGKHLVIMPNVPVGVCGVCGGFGRVVETIARRASLLGINPSRSDASSPLSTAYGPDNLTCPILTRRRSV